MSTTADVHTLSGAYALDALGPEEAAVFREHLEGCAACRQEVRELRDAAARMGAVETVRPPAELRARVLAAADRTPQQPPVPRTDARSSVTSLAGREPRRARPGRRWERLVVAAAAVLLVGGGAVGLSRVLGGSDPEQLSPYDRVVQAEDARSVEEPTMNGGELVVAVSPEQNEMAVDTSGLPALDDGRVYQLWTIHGTEDIVSVAVIESPGENAAMELPPSGTSVAVTIEPAGGSEQPTKAPIVQLEPAAV